MATQPRIPRDRGARPHLVPRSTRRRSRRPNKLLVALIAVTGAALILAVLVPYILHGPRRSAPVVASGPLLQQPNDGALQVVNAMQIAGDPASDTLTLTGQLTNKSSRLLNGAQVQLAFRDQKGKTIATLDRPIAGIAGGNCDAIGEFAKHPIKPNELRFFCVSVNPIPDGWNHEPPATDVVTVTSPD